MILISEEVEKPVDDVSHQLSRPGDLVMGGLAHGLFYRDEELSVRGEGLGSPQTGMRFLLGGWGRRFRSLEEPVVEGDDIGGTRVVEIVLIELAHLEITNQVNSEAEGRKLAVLGGETFNGSPKGWQRNRAHALPVANDDLDWFRHSIDPDGRICRDVPTGA